MSTAAGHNAGSWLSGAAAPSAVAWGDCCIDGASQAPDLDRPFPWLRLAIGLFVAAQTMTLGLAINIDPPSEAETATRLWLHGGMLVATLVVVALLGVPLVVEAAAQLRRGRLTMEALFIAGLAGAGGVSIAAVIRGEGDVYFDVVCILLIVYSLGRAVSLHSRNRAMAAMTELTRTLSTARRVPEGHANTEAAAETVAVADLMAGDIVRILPGDILPIDGTVVSGTALLRETAFTGQWMAAPRRSGDNVMAGTVCEDGALLVRVRGAGPRRLDRIAAMIEQARELPGAMQRQADRFVRTFLPIVLMLTAATALGWSLVADPATGVIYALAVLLVACPCAAGLATPLVTWALMGRLARRGLVLRTGEAVERLATADSIIFDKTGTLGDQTLRVERIEMRPSWGAPERRAALLATVAAIERRYDHPVARALQSLDCEVDNADRAVIIEAVEALPGRGVAAQVRMACVEDEPVRIEILRADEGVTVTADGRTAMLVRLEERVRESVQPALQLLSSLGLRQHVLTGDRRAAVAPMFGGLPVYARMSPEQKVVHIEQYRRDGQTRGEPHRPVLVGDGLNDAAAMRAAWSSVALDGGSDVTVHTADATLYGGDLTLLPRAVALARRGVRVIRTNFLWAVSYNITGIILAMAGVLHPIAAALLMATSSVIVSWRSFALTARLDEQLDRQGQERWPIGARVVAAAAAPAPLKEVAAALPLQRPDVMRGIQTVQMLAWAGGGVVLAAIAGLGLLETAALLMLFAVSGGWIVSQCGKLPPWADMTWSMVALGGFGMNLGWWADLGFTGGAAAAGACACCAAADGGPVALLSWMNAGMLALGVPAMFLLRYRPQPWSWRKWCCSGMLFIGVPGMVVGMGIGSSAAVTWLSGAEPALAQLGHYLLMMAGMVVGMLLPHALGYAVKQDW